jgi:hypothetical protein
MIKSYRDLEVWHKAMDYEDLSRRIPDPDLQLLAPVNAYQLSMMLQMTEG